MKRKPYDPTPPLLPIKEQSRSKLNPTNKRDAYCYQLRDDLKVLQSFALLNLNADYERQAKKMILLLKQSLK